MILADTNGCSIVPEKPRGSKKRLLKNRICKPRIFTGCVVANKTIFIVNGGVCYFYFVNEVIEDDGRR